MFASDLDLTGYASRIRFDRATNLRRKTSKSAAFVSSSAAGRRHGGCGLGLNKGHLALLFFERYVVDLLRTSLLDQDADEFRSSSR